MFNIRQATKDDIPALYELYNHIGVKHEGYFERIFEKDCIVLMAALSGQAIGFSILNFEPRYSLYKKLNIPEIQDLNVIPQERQKGIATAIIKECEKLAKAKGCEHIGIAVALTKDYGAAQRLYTKLGYIPDGNGVTYEREPIEGARHYPVDDDLCLMMVKEL